MCEAQWAWYAGSAVERDGIDDVEQQGHGEQEEHQRHHGCRDRSQLPNVCFPMGDPLVHGYREVSAVERIERESVEDPEHDVDHGNQTDHEFEVALGAQTNDADRTDRSDLIRYIRVPEESPAQLGERRRLDQISERVEGAPGDVDKSPSG